MRAARATRTHHGQTTWPGSRARARCTSTLGRRTVERRRAAHLRAAAVLRGAAARPRVHRGAGHHRPDLRDLPGRLPDERVRRDGGRCAACRSTPARCARCAGCSTAASGSRATRCTSTCCTRRTSSATRTRSRWRRTIARLVERGLALKKAGNAMLDADRRPRDPPRSTSASAASTARPTRARACARSPSRCERARDLALDDGRVGRRASTSPTWSARSELRRAAATRRRYPIDAARIVSDGGLDITARRVRRALRRGARRALQRAARAPARAGRLPDRPARALRARLATSCARWPARPRPTRAWSATAATRSAASSSGPSSSSTRATRRCAIIDGYEQPGRARRSPSCRGAAAGPRRQRGAARHALPPLRASTRTAPSSTPRSSRRPRRTSPRSRTTCARSSQQHLDLPDDAAAHRCEQAIRNHDPCISCATHFLELTVERV